MPNYFFITLSVCFSLITLTLVYRNIFADMVRKLKRKKTLFKEMQDEIIDLENKLAVQEKIAECEVNNRSFDEGMLSFMTMYYNEVPTTDVMERCIKIGSMLPGIGHPYGPVIYNQPDQKFYRVVP